MAERSFTILMTTSTAVPVKNRKALFCAVARYFPVYPIWSARFAFKGRLRGANKAEAQVVVAVVRVVVVPVADRRVVGVVVPGATTFDAVRTRRRAEPCRFLQENTVLIFSFFLQKECYSQAARATAASLAWLTPSFCTHIGLLRGANKAEAQVVVAVVRVAVVPVANRRAVGVVAPGATT